MHDAGRFYQLTVLSRAVLHAVPDSQSDAHKEVAVHNMQTMHFDGE